MSIDLIRWLEDQPLFPKVYWRERDGLSEMAAAGAKEIHHSIPSVKKGSSEIYFGGISFSAAKQDALWKDFPALFFFLPEHLRVQKPYSSSIPSVKLRHEQNSPELPLWTENVLNAIAAEGLDKVVLARRSTFEFASPFSLLSKLQTRAKSATLFYFQPTGESAFLGATPEMLYSRQGAIVTSDALAGTRPLGKEFEKELTSSLKEKREFAFVKSYIYAQLSSLCTKIQKGKTHVRKTAVLQHLYSRLSGTLRPEISDHDLLAALHPTPAVAGTPTKEALDFLLRHEPFCRGWYAAPVGWISGDAARFAVAIRSALVTQKKVHLFSGTGIVQGSDPKREWQELEEKISLFL